MGAYGDALRAAGGRSLEAALRAMGDGEDAALEVGEFEARGGTRLLVLGFDRARLARHAPLAHTPPCARSSGLIVLLYVLLLSGIKALVRTVRGRVLAQLGGQRPDAGWAGERRARLAAGQSCGTPTRSPGPCAGFARSQRPCGL